MPKPRNPEDIPPVDVEPDPHWTDTQELSEEVDEVDDRGHFDDDHGKPLVNRPKSLPTKGFEADRAARRERRNRA